MQSWRTRPVLFAAFLGALIGFGNALAIEIPVFFGKPSKGVLTLLEPASHFHTGSNGVVQIAFMLMIEVGANVLVYSGMFSLLGLLVLAFRRIFASRRSPAAENHSPEK
jgi:hypothetical protein